MDVFFDISKALYVCHEELLYKLESYGLIIIISVNKELPLMSRLLLGS